MIISTVTAPAAKSLFANMPIVILFKAVRGVFAGKASSKPVQGVNLPSASFR